MLYLQEMVKKGMQSRDITLNERLPSYLIAPCHLNVHYQVEAKDDFYLIHMHTFGDLHIQCQRCLDEFSFHYDNKTLVAVCRDDERADRLLELYECIVSANLQVSLEELLIDELHLYIPQFHPELAECSSELNQFLSG